MTDPLSRENAEAAERLRVWREAKAQDDRLHGIVRHYVDQADQTLDALAVAMADEGFAMMSNVDLARIVVAFGEMRRALYGD